MAEHNEKTLLKNCVIDLESESDTVALGAQLAKVLVQRFAARARASASNYSASPSSGVSGGGTVFLQGDLGAGKSTLARSIIRALGYEGAVRSPTYTLVERYPTEPMPCCHFDLYRMADPEELEFIGMREDLSSNNLCLIEWPSRGEGWLEKADLEVDIRLNYLKKGSQVIKITRQIDIRWHNSFL